MDTKRHQNKPEAALPAPGKQLGVRASLVAVCLAVLSGCASMSNTEKSAWLDQPSRRIPVTGTNVVLDAATLRTAEQNPMTRQALDLIGIRYRFGGHSPDKGFDCSGLVSYTAQESLGLKLPRRSADIARVGTQINQTELLAGDLVFFNTLGRRYSHVGIYLGSGYFVHAPAAGGKVRVEDMSAAYWKKRYNGARRIEPVRLAAKQS